MLIIATSSFIFSKKLNLDKSAQQVVSKLLIYFVNPCLIISRFNIEFDFQKLKSLACVFVIAVVLHLVMIFVAILLVRSKDPFTKDLQGIERVALVFTNCAFIGIPLIDGVFPNSNGIFYLLGFIITFNIFIWTFGYMMLCGKINIIRVIKNPNIIALLIGMLIFCLPIRLPEIVDIPLKTIASMNTPLAMFLLGLLFANFDNFKVEYLLRALKVCFIRFVVMGVVCLAVVFAFKKLFYNVQDIRLMCYVCYIAALCPVGMTVSSFAVLFNKDESYSGLLVLATSVVCVVTLPLSVRLAELVSL